MSWSPTIALRIAFLFTLAASGHAFDGSEAQAQAPALQSQQGQVTIYATGSFLGQFDGLVLYPGHSRDRNTRTGRHPYGGLLGVEDWLKRRMGVKEKHELLLVAGDNQAHSFARWLRGTRADDDGSIPSMKAFWHRLLDLKPDAIGLWSEDFYRALAPPTKDADSNAGRLAKWLAERRLGNLLASNAAIRTHRRRLNTVDGGWVELEVERDASLGWVQALSLGVDCDRRDLSYTLRHGGSEVQSGKLAATGQNDPCHAEIELKAPLRPGRQYGLEVRSSQGFAHLAFTTDRALTPIEDGLAAVVPPDRLLPVIVGMVDPGIRKRLPQKNWEWRQADDTLECAGSKCEILFHDPIDAFRTIQLWLAPHSERYFALLAGLSDADALKLLYDTDAIKFVVLPADTGLLGRGAAERASGTPAVTMDAGQGATTVPDPPYAGDAGNVALIDADVGPVARAWARVQWMGANGAVMSARVIRRDPAPDRDGDTPNPPDWDVTSLSATSAAVPGYGMCAEAETGDPTVRYWATKFDETSKTMRRDPGVAFELAWADRYPVFAPDLTYDGRHAQGNLWIDPAEFAGLTLDRMREALDAEIAILPANTVDDDYIDYFAQEQQAGRALNWMSREILKRALFRADRAVRVKIQGSKLAEQLEKILAAGRSEDRSYCAAGLGSTSCKLSKVEADHLRVNGRKVQPDHFYGVAMPAGLAAEFGLDEADVSESLIDLVDAVFKTEQGPGFSTCGQATAPTPPASAAVTPLAERLETRVARRQAYYVLKPFGAELSLTELSEPDVEGYRGSFASLPLAGGKADDQIKWALDGGVDAGFDWRKVVLHGIGTIKFGRTRIHPHTDAEPTKSTDPDEYRFGGRVDWRAWPTDAEGRFYAGLFQEGELSADRVFGKDDPWPEPDNRRRRRYRYATVGAEVDNWLTIGKFTIKQLRGGLSTGRSYAEEQGVHVNGGEAIPLAQPLTEILKKLEEEGVEVTSLQLQYLEARRTRAELEALFALPLYAAHGRDAKLALTTKYFFYYDTKNPVLRFVERHSARASVELTFPLWRVFDAGLTLENQRVWLRDGKLYSVFRSSATVKWPLFGKRGAGMIW